MRARSLIVLVLAAAPLAMAQTPRTIGYQALLTDQSANPKPDGTYSITFRLYDTPSGGTALWSETRTVTLSKGTMSVAIGDSSGGISLPFDKPYYLGVAVEGANELAPRTKLASGAYSLRAAVADSAARAGGAATAANATNAARAAVADSALKVARPFTADSAAKAFRADTAGRAGYAASAGTVSAASHAHSALAASDGAPNPAVVVDTAGYVGIGIPAPNSKLEITGGGSENLLRVSSTDGDAKLAVSLNANRKGWMFFRPDANSDGNRVTIDTAGKVGIRRQRRHRHYVPIREA